MEQIRISGKDLGYVALPDFCPRCFWIKRKIPRSPPYQIFPGIFSSIDAYSKKVIHSWFDRHGSATPWLTDLGALESYIDPPHFTKFNTIDHTTNTLLTGAPDGIYVRPSSEKIIVDYKTAKFTPSQDALLPVYQTQLNVYAIIAHAVGIKPVTELYLIYTEPMTGVKDADTDSIHRESEFNMGFASGVHQVEINPGLVPPLLVQVREILSMDSPPNRQNECKDCEKVDAIVKLLEAETG